MANYDIFVPLFSWLIGGSRIGGSYNIYCASRGTDVEKGCMGKDIFNYRIWIEKLDEQEILKAAVYYGLKSFDNQNEDDITVKVFDFEEESLAEIKNWLEEMAESFFSE